MANPPKKMEPLTSADLQKIIADIETGLNTTWAVYGDYDEHMNWSVVKIVPWAERDKDAMAMKVEGAVDELEAYKKVMERLTWK